MTKIPDSGEIGYVVSASVMQLDELGYYVVIQARRCRRSSSAYHQSDIMWKRRRLFQLEDSRNIAVWTNDLHDIDLSVILGPGLVLEWVRSEVWPHDCG